MKKSNIILLIVLCVALIAAITLGACNSDTSDASSSSPLLPTTAEDDASKDASQSADDSSNNNDGDDLPGGASAADNTGGDGMGTPAPDADAPSTPEGDGPHTFTGTIDSAGMGKFFVEVEGGYILPVEYQNADLSALSDSRPGAAVVVTYTGRLDGADTSGITVVSVANP